jgi:hypothetical protein
MKTQNFKIINKEGKEVELLVRSPSAEDQKQATKVYNQAFSDAIKSKAIVRAKLDDVLTEQGLWDGNKQVKFLEYQTTILEGERQLAKGGISINQARDIALNMKKAREDLKELISVKTNLDIHTAEGQADNARFNYLVSACTVYSDTKEQYFKGYDDYLNRSGEVAALLSAQHLAAMIYGLDNDYEDKLPENKFLKKYKFVDTKLRLINKEGKLVDSDGRLIDESGRFINDKGEFVDKDGNVVDQEGDYVVDFKPFLDDNGQPVLVEEKKDETINTTSEITEEKQTS